MVKNIIYFFSNNFRLKLSALILSIMAWYYIQGAETASIGKKVLVHIKVKDNFLVKNGALRYNYINIKGPRSLINDLSSQTEIKAQIDLEDEDKGIHEYQITTANLLGYETSSRLDVTFSRPIMSVEIDESFNKTVEVKEILTGSPAEGKYISKVSISPKRVTLTGMKSDLIKIKEIVTLPIDIDKIEKNRIVEAQLNLPRNFSSDHISAKTVKVNFQVDEKKINKKFRNLPIKVLGTNLKSSTQPSSVTVELQFTQSELNFVSEDDITVYVEASELQAGQHEKKILVKIPGNTTLIETIPQNTVLELNSSKKTKESMK